MIMAMIRPETEMKDSGIEWIGDIPKEWHVVKGKYILRQLSRPVLESDSVVTCFRDGEVTLRSNRRESGFTNSLKETGYQGVEPGDLVVHGMDGFAGAIGISDSRGKMSPIINVLDSSECKKYLMYYLRGLAFVDVFLGLSTGIRERSCDLRWNKLANLEYIIPPLSEQQTIADYLDEICSKIDEIIAEAKASIDEYKELKQSVITQTVTMNNHTKLMETGNKILPKLPISWNLVRIKNLFSNEEKPLRVGPFGSQLTTKDYLDSGYWVYTQRNVLDNNFATNDIFISDEKYEELKAFAVKENDILITTRGSGTPGHVAKVPHNYKKGILHPCLMRFRLDEDKCLYEYLRFVFEFSTYIREQIDSASNTTAIPVLYSDTLKNLYMPLPSIEEQKEIIEKLITFEKKIDSLIAEKESLINDLEAYKKSLIYEVVTGKRRVV